MCTYGSFHSGIKSSDRGTVLDNNNVFYKGGVMSGNKVLFGVRNSLKMKVTYRYIKYPQKHKLK